jgi:hypothetical protein
MRRCELDLVEADVYASGWLFYRVQVYPYGSPAWMTWRFALGAERAAWKVVRPSVARDRVVWTHPEAKPEVAVGAPEG